MNTHDMLEVVKRPATLQLSGTVKNGKVAVKLPEGTPVTVEVVEAVYPIDGNGNIKMTPEEQERELQLGIAEADAGLLVPAHEVIASLRAIVRNGNHLPTPEEEALELKLAIAELDAGRWVPARDVLAELRADLRKWRQARRRAKASTPLKRR